MFASGSRKNRAVTICSAATFRSFRSEEHKYELQSQGGMKDDVLCLKKKNKKKARKKEEEERRGERGKRKGMSNKHKKIKEKEGKKEET